MKRQPKPLALTLRGKRRVVAYACRVCRVVAPDAGSARKCCNNRCACGVSIRSYENACCECGRAAREAHRAQREQDERASASKVELADYLGTHLTRGDASAHLVAAAHLDDDEIDSAPEHDGRRFLWGCTAQKPSLDLRRAVYEDALAEAHEGASYWVNEDALDRAQAALDEALAPVVSYYDDRTTMVLLPKEKR